MPFLSFFKRLFNGPEGLSVSAAEAHTLISGSEGLQLIDVRTEMEFKSGAIPGARLLPLQALGFRLGELDPAKPVLLYCRSGHRSGLALNLLLKRGFSQVRHIEGGYLSWKKIQSPQR